MTETPVAETITNRAAEAAQYEKDILYLHPSEHSSIALTSTPLDGTNFLAWQRAVYVSLGTKMKLGFIDGSFPCPAVGSIHYEQWRRVDLTVTSWIWKRLLCIAQLRVNFGLLYKGDMEGVMVLWCINYSAKYLRYRSKISLLLHILLES
ncbi:UNVERIFIED_CONTAM: hypothetical protein Sradi_0269400 [Sesamum radiatum]|uniref:Retrotransposon Copia-like N-terminal domain-containing protein n=1 Tax=Sesamum radiatum TaxID=300843 RepID=A0AAW2W680_SESRA